MGTTSIQGMQAEANTVAAFNRANARLGGGLRLTAPFGAGRTYAQQAMLRGLYLVGRGSYAAPPGTSNHEFSVNGGTALDISNWASYPNLRNVMQAEGFTRDPVEKWHYNFRGATSPAGAPGTATPATTLHPRTDDNMILLYITDNCDGNNRPGWWWLNPRSGKFIPLVAGTAEAQAQANSWARTSGPSTQCSRQDGLNLVAGIQQTL